MLVADSATNKERMIAYAWAQEQDMRTTYNVMYKRDGDFGKEMTFKEFLPHYIEHGHAKRFHDENYHKYFKGDSHEETK